MSSADEADLAMQMQQQRDPAELFRGIWGGGGVIWDNGKENGNCNLGFKV